MTDQTLSLPSGGGIGGLGGSFAPDLNTGGGGYSVPIDVPDGRNGHTPRLTLRYATGQPSGPFGLGWDFGLLRLDRRIVPSEAEGHEGLFAPGVGLLRESADDPSRFVPETDGLVWSVRRSGEGFEIVQRDGVRHRLGTTAAARETDPDDPTVVGAWLVERSEAPDGSVIDHAYVADGARRLIASITWATYRLSFGYEARPDPIHDARAGFLRSSERRCRTIELELVADAPTVVRRWTLGYTQAEPSGHSQLASVRVAGVDTEGAELELPPTLFGYHDADDDRPRLRALPGTVATALLDGATFADLSGDALPDAVDLRPGRIALARNRGALQFDPMRRIAANGIPGFGTGHTYAADVGGRGRVDLVSTGSGLAYRYPIEGDAEVGRPIVGRDRPALAVGAPEVRVVDVDGDRAIDLIAVNRGIATIDRQRGVSWETTRRVVGAGLPADIDTSNEGVRFASVKGDGLPDIVSIRSGEVRWWPALGQARWGAVRNNGRRPRAAVGLPRRPTVRRRCRRRRVCRHRLRRSWGGANLVQSRRQRLRTRTRGAVRSRKPCRTG